MYNMKQEKILCIARKNLEQAVDLHAGIVPLSSIEANQLFSSIPYCFIDRNIAEHDSSFKQVIPYCILQNEQGDFFVYDRKGSESRLHGFSSLGIGGHINETDTGTDLFSIIISGATRELIEELPSLRDILPALFQKLVSAQQDALLVQHAPSIVMHGLINEELSTVGSVHVGLVIGLVVSAEMIVDVDTELFEWRWVSAQELRLDSFETWSQLAYRLLLAKHAKITATTSSYPFTSIV